MREETTTTQSTELTDLGAATEVTLGIYDPTAKEEFIVPEARDDA